jgi:arylsulfatase A-like enzyme
MLIALADHGGGGRAIRRHDSDHVLDRTIPIVFGGGAVRPATLAAGTRLLDVPATILAALGVPTPESYAGVSLTRTRVATPLSNQVEAAA